MKFYHSGNQFVRTLVGIYFFSVCCYATEFKLVSISFSENSDVDSGIKNEKKDDIFGEFFLIESLHGGDNELGIKITNNTKKLIKISRFQLAHDESYVLELSGKILLYPPYNHSAIESAEKVREIEGKRWLEIPAGGNVTVSLNPASWGALKNVKHITSREKFTISARSRIFGSSVVNLSFIKVPSKEDIEE